jgi:hypothetical protein
MPRSKRPSLQAPNHVAHSNLDLTIEHDRPSLQALNDSTRSVLCAAANTRLDRVLFEAPNHRSIVSFSATDTEHDRLSFQPPNLRAGGVVNAADAVDTRFHCPPFQPPNLIAVDVPSVFDTGSAAYDFSFLSAASDEASQLYNTS